MAWKTAANTSDILKRPTILSPLVTINDKCVPITIWYIAVSIEVISSTYSPFGRGLHVILHLHPGCLFINIIQNAFFQPIFLPQAVNKTR